MRLILKKRTKKFQIKFWIVLFGFFFFFGQIQQHHQSIKFYLRSPAKQEREADSSATVHVSPNPARTPRARPDASRSHLSGNLTARRRIARGLLATIVGTQQTTGQQQQQHHPTPPHFTKQLFFLLLNNLFIILLSDAPTLSTTTTRQTLARDWLVERIKHNSNFYPSCSITTNPAHKNMHATAQNPPLRKGKDKSHPRS